MHITFRRRFGSKIGFGILNVEDIAAVRRMGDARRLGDELLVGLGRCRRTHIRARSLTVESWSVFGMVPWLELSPGTRDVLTCSPGLGIVIERRMQGLH